MDYETIISCILFLVEVTYRKKNTNTPSYVCLQHYNKNIQTNKETKFELFESVDQSSNQSMDSAKALNNILLDTYLKSTMKSNESINQSVSD